MQLPKQAGQLAEIGNPQGQIHDRLVARRIDARIDRQDLHIACRDHVADILVQALAVVTTHEHIDLVGTLLAAAPLDIDDAIGIEQAQGFADSLGQQVGRDVQLAIEGKRAAKGGQRDQVPLGLCVVAPSMTSASLAGAEGFGACAARSNCASSLRSPSCRLRAICVGVTSPRASAS